MRGDPGDGSPRTFSSPKLARLPMKPLLAVGEKAREYPHRYHWNIQTALLAETAHIRDRADFLLERPEYRKAKPGIMKDTIAPATMINETSPRSNWLESLFNNDDVAKKSPNFIFHGFERYI